MVESYSSMSEEAKSQMSALLIAEITPEFVKNMTSASDRLFCHLRDNKVLRFGAYTIKDYLSGTVLMHITEE